MRANQLAALGEMAAGVAHEINNPIAGIINYAELLQQRTQDDSYAKEILKGITKEGWRIANIVKNLLEHSRFGEANYELVDMNEVVKNTLSLVGTQIEKEGITLDLHCEEHISHIGGNKQQIEQILMNLFSNSRHALNGKYPDAHIDKILRISLQERLLDDRLHVVLNVWDQGTGISREIANKVMNPFFTTKPAGVGTGLGLSISHDLVKKYNGQIHIESEPGSFTNVEVAFPAQESV